MTVAPITFTLTYRKDTRRTFVYADADETITFYLPKARLDGGEAPERITLTVTAAS